MTNATQQITVQTPRPPAPPGVDPNEISARIEEAVQRALSQSGQGGNRNVGESIREAIEEVKAEIAQARADGVSEITVRPQFGDNVIPSGAVDISIAFFLTVAAIIIGFPIMRAIARRIERGTPVAAPIPVEVRDQLTQIAQSVDAIAIEVERISEGQRFTTKMLADRNREGAQLKPGQD